MNFNITAYSTALFSTWIFIEELGILFDAGDGVSAGLLQKTGKIKQVFITHPDRDHLTGLMQLNQLNGKKGFPKIYYPQDSKSFPFFESFLHKFDPHTAPAEWIPITHDTHIPIKNGIDVYAFRNNHINTPETITKSLSYKVVESKQKLKPIYQNLSGNEIKNLRDQYGIQFLTEIEKRTLIGYSGDTPVDNYEKWDHTDILIHEATFIDDTENPSLKMKGNRHSRLEEVFKMLMEIKVNQLVLTHFSPRYKKQDINSAIQQYLKKYPIDIPIHVVYPGTIQRNLLNKPHF